ncbi:MAG: hypothetical protein MPN21_27290 [Thermoanaerobaculia bacterium]|nr:hypothetical protein [Thermoanaerobaculia bacterium]
MHTRVSGSRPIHPLHVGSVLLALALGSGSAFADDDRAALLAEPQYVEPAQKPKYVTLTPDALRGSIQVVAARTYAYYGFNNPEMQIHLPLIDNSTLAQVDMPEPRLVDSSGGKVAYQLERGLHDPETQIAEIRFLTTDGESPATFARAIGKISVRYPLVVETLANHPGVHIDGPFVDIDDGVLPETAPFAEVQPLRAYDSQGRQLKSEPTGSTRVEGERVIRRLGFHGEVARVEVDQISQWTAVEISYDVPIAEPLPDSQRATSVDDRARTPDPRSKIEIDIAEPSRLSVQARSLADALAALRAELPADASIVSLNGSPPTYVSISVDSGDRVEEWTWNTSGVSGPNPVVTDWLDCKKGMAPGAPDLEKLPALLDAAAQRVNTGDRPIQIVVGQSPCGTPFIHIPFDGGRSVQFDGDGEVVGEN